ncbi:MAG: biopolymer transporter ExbB [Alphaproteobacteria bacterium]|nr:MAG: biopolymer transporter ExbB [Alphaproteobacteria bacterium]
MSSPNKYAFRMVLLLVIVMIISYLLYQPLIDAFEGNREINGLIIFTFLAGVLLSFRQTSRLSKERNWLQFVKKNDVFLPDNYKTSKIKPELLAPIAALLLEKKNENTSLTANSLSTILGGVSSRLDENRDIIRYIIGLLVFLGLLGTFWGLLQTISSVSSVIQSLEISVNENNANFFDKIIKGLNAPMEGMSTAFSSSLFGLGTSIILGFLDLQVSQANNRFFNELEDWLSQKAIFTTPSETKNIELGEVALENLAVISKNYINTENEKVKTSERLNELNLLLSRLTEKLDDEKNIKHSIDELNMNVKNIIENDKIHSNELINNINLELRALSKVIEKLNR